MRNRCGRCGSPKELRCQRCANIVEQLAKEDEEFRTEFLDWLADVIWEQIAEHTGRYSHESHREW